MAHQRKHRVQEQLVREVSDIIRRELKDPRLGFITLTDAEVTPDLRFARIYYSVLGPETEQEETQKILTRASSFIRGEFGRRVHMRIIPEIRFVYDKAVERGARIGQLLEQVRRDEQESKSASEAGGGADPESE